MTAELIFELAWKSLAVAGLALLVLRMMNKRSAAERSWIAHAGLIATLLLPLAVLASPDWKVEALEPVARIVSASEPAPAMPVAKAARPSSELAAAPAALASIRLPSLSAQDFVTLVYGIPAALLTLLLLIAIIRLQLLRARAEVLVEPRWATALAAAQRRMGFKHGTALLVSGELSSPISWGVVRPVILLDPRAAADTQQAEAIIAHELAHVARLDWAMLMLGRLATAIFWFNPLVWLLARRCHELSEQAVDDSVLRSNIRNTDYAELLISTACHDNRAILLAANGVAGSGPLTERVERVLDRSQPRAPARWSWIAGCCGATLMVGGPLSAVSPMDGRTAPVTGSAQSAARNGADAHASASGRTVVVQGQRMYSIADANLPKKHLAPQIASTRPSALEEALIKAVASDDAGSTNALLASGVSANASVVGDGSPLIVAARNGRLDMVRDLLARGANIDIGVQGDGNPLIAAAAAGHLNVVRYLLDQGANIEAIVPTDENALMQAAYHGREDVVRLLVARGANVNSRYAVRTPLSMARRGGHREIEELLLKWGARP